MFTPLLHLIEMKSKKSSMGRSLPVENQLSHNVVSIINYLQWSTEVAQWGTPSCSRPQPAVAGGQWHQIW